jgi:hypothetical protein
MDSLDKRPKLKMEFGMWNVRSLYRTGSLITPVKGLSNYMQVLVSVKATMHRGGTESAGQYK